MGANANGRNAAPDRPAPQPTSPRVAALADAPPQRWRNGGGITRELLAWPSPERWWVRVSVADVDRDGPFSTFPGVDRWFAVVAGAGVELAIDGVTRRVEPGGPPMAFSGGAAVSARLLAGPTRDLNLMLRGGRGGMWRAAAGRTWRPRAASCGLFATAGGACTSEASRVEVPAHALVWFDRAPSRLRFEAATGDAAAWWIAATPSGGDA